MALKILPGDVRSILCASAQINNYSTAVAELVYNSLDAESSSIAIRVHILENRIQVIDNGNGISKNDFAALGQRYMTSKLTDLSTLKSIPKCYGYRGEFLASLIEISQNVKVISRHKDGDETWAKTINKGKKKQFAKMTTRPSKGTTVEVSDFLYNLHIQKRRIDSVNDLQKIKSFLEQLSVAHNDISLSLRDDSKNEIVFKIHKKRDVYQTLSTLFDIERTVVQEFQVEKNQYKIKAYIGKSHVDMGRHWIYLNGRFIQSNSKLHKIINEYLKKYLQIKCKNILKSKKNHDEDALFKQNLPFYFVFVTCPYIDYHISSTVNQSDVEFKNWQQVKNIVEKLIKFYIGDIKLIEANKMDSYIKLKQSNDDGNSDTPDKIKKIINKILGSNLGISQLHNGVKGKLANRKIRKKNKKSNKKKKCLEKRTQISIAGSNQDQYKNTYVQSPNKSTHNIGPLQTTISIEDISVPINNQVEPTMDLNNSKQYCNVTHNRHIDRIENTSKINQDNNVIHKKKRLAFSSEANLEKHSTSKKYQIKKLKNKNNKNRKNKKKSELNIKKLTRSCKYQIKPNKTVMNKNTNQHTIVEYKDIKLISESQDDIFRHTKKTHITPKKDDNYSNTVNIFIRNQYNNNDETCNEILHPKRNNCNIKKYMTHEVKLNPFKTTYDLVQTVLESQRERRFYQNHHSPEVYFRDYSTFNRNLATASTTIPRTSIKRRLQNIEYTTFNTNQGREAMYKNNKMSSNLASCELTHNGSQYIDWRYNNTLNNNTPIEVTQHSLRCEDIFKANSDMLCTHNGTSYYSSNIQGSRLTYESHNYNQYISGYTNRMIANKTNKTDMDRCVSKINNKRFITKQSRDNFVSNENYKSVYKSNYKLHYEKQYNKWTNFNKKRIKQTMDESYAIEFTKSSNNNSSIKCRGIVVSNHSNFSMCNINDKTYSMPNTHSLNYYELASDIDNTYTIPTYSISSKNNMYYVRNQAKCINSANEPLISNSPFYSNLNENIFPRSANLTSQESVFQYQDNDSIVFVSKPLCPENEQMHDNSIQPVELCEAVLSPNESHEKDIHSHYSNGLNYSVYGNNESTQNNRDNIEKCYTQIIKRHSNDEISHHFSNTITTNDLNIINAIEANLQILATNENVKEINKTEECIPYLQNDNVEFNEEILFSINRNEFDFQDRLRFLPKGMSQIFEKCGSKTICDYNLDKDYYEDDIYKYFANDVQMHAEIYEPMVQNADEMTTKDNLKFESKIYKDNASIIFGEISLKGAKVLNQVDNKFITAIMKEKDRAWEKSPKYLVLFDQHAVHERIRLEQNLTDYMEDNRWKSVPLDNITLKINKDEILYLHNYKDKFIQLGLEWTILNKDQVILNSIPEAILGKNSREVDKVMKAVKNLIVEQIEVIKLQKGCISLYPKSIMDLVFNEACRYAIKFGDRLSKSDCIDLINSLSKCKTPFQCAHGRPVMAVLLDIKSDLREYKVNKASLRRFKLNKKSIDI